MSGAQPFSRIHITKQYSSAYEALDSQRRKQADKAFRLLAENPAYPGLNTHPIQPDKYYWEAYLNANDRIVYRPEGPLLIFVDIIKHDDIPKYGRAPKQK